MTEPHLHFIEDGRFVCKGDQSATCRNYPSCECEQWTEEHDKVHMPVPQDECWVGGWMSGVGLDDLHDEDALTDWHRRHETDEDDLADWPDGPIEAEWSTDVESVIWRYADLETAS